MQSLPAHEAHHLAEDRRQPRPYAGRGRGRPADRRQGAARGRADDPSQELTTEGRHPASAAQHRYPGSRRQRGDSMSLLCPDAFLSPLAIEEAVARALEEDLGRAGDVTSIATIPDGTRGAAVMVARKAGVIAGLPMAAAAFSKLGSALRAKRD